MHEGRFIDYRNRWVKPNSRERLSHTHQQVHVQFKPTTWEFTSKFKETKIQKFLLCCSIATLQDFIYIYNPLNMGPKFQAKRERATHGHGDQQLHLPKGDFFPLFHHTSCKLVVLLWIYDGFTFSGAWSNEMLLSKCQLKQIYSRGRTDVNRHESNMLHRMFMQL